MNGISVSTVIRYFDRLAFKWPLHLLGILSLDEFRGNAYGQRYQVAVNNPQTHEILDILPKRNTAEMIRYFSQFFRTERINVKFVVMGLFLLFSQNRQDYVPVCRHHRRSFLHTTTGPMGLGTGKKNSTEFVPRKKNIL